MLALVPLVVAGWLLVFIVRCWRVTLPLAVIGLIWVVFAHSWAWGTVLLVIVSALALWVGHIREQDAVAARRRDMFRELDRVEAEQTAQYEARSEQYRLMHLQAELNAQAIARYANGQQN